MKKKKMTPVQQLLVVTFLLQQECNNFIIPPHMLHSSSLQGWGQSCVGLCSSPIVVDLQQQIDTGPTRVFTATSGIGGIGSGELEMMTRQIKNTLNSAAAPPLKADFTPDKCALNPVY
ncbi:hypothetical protein CDAR_208701 [Caerostris darwini]|uniref:Uncharacterized protein n=1 Tax=Caerostris darwini TaxID=1538125 RepID=A0AAV4VSQ9_9ARAC|nr:hypothetical protein CDAR_208701 [Caerostris darwini]